MKNSKKINKTTNKKSTIKSNKKNLYNTICLIYFSSLILFVSIGSILITYSIIDVFIYSKSLIIFGIVGFIIYLLYKYFFERELKTQDLLIILMAFCDYISYYFTDYRRIALWGFVGRREGLFILYTYYAIFLVATTISNKKYLKYILYLFITHCLLNIGYGTLQMFKVNNFLGLNIEHYYMYSPAFIGNSNNFSSLMIIFNGLCLGYYLFNNNFNNRQFYISLLLLITSIIGLVISGAMSGIVGVIAMNILILFIYFLKKDLIQHAKKKYLIYIILVLFFSFSISLINKNDYLEDITNLSQKIIDVDNENNTIDNGRIHIWKEALSCYPEHMLTGVGIDAFYYLCGYNNQIIDPTANTVVDKAHNEYLQYLTTEGIFKLIFYLIFIIYVLVKPLIKLIKNKKEFNYYLIALLIAFFGYIVQAFFNISITRVTPIFYILMGIIITFSVNNIKEVKNE